jgi:phosphodiesterase/alkaline phosphatase D-like protein
LTGDQIYADDVAMPLIQYLTKFGIELLGWEEQIHGLNKKLTEIGIGERQQIMKDHEDIYRKQLDQLKCAYHVLPKVRRVLANIPTYMIFDDHDITDDWNITEE